MSIKTAGIMSALGAGLALVLCLFFLFREVKSVNQQLGAVTQALETVQEVNAQNLKDFLSSKEFSDLVEGMRVDRQAIINEINTRLDEHLTDYSRARENDTEVKSWDSSPVPSWIITKNSREVGNASK